MKQKLPKALVLAASFCSATTASAALVTYEFSFTAEDVLSYSFANGADGSTAADNGLFNGARLTRNDGTGNKARTYVQSQHSAFTDWATSTDDKMTIISLWGFNNDQGAPWGEGFKHADREMVSAPDNWADWSTVGWNPAWGSNPNPYTDRTVGWYAGDSADGMGFGDVGLASEEFRFQMSFNTSDWLYSSADTNGAPNSLGGPMTFWFGTYMGDADNPYQYIYEGNLVLTGTQQVPLPAPLLLLGFGLAGLGLFRLRR